MQKTSTVKNIKNGRNVVSIEKKSIEDLHKRFSNKNFSGNFSEAVELIYKSKGKVVVTGIGKSGIIAYKIAAHSADIARGRLQRSDILFLH